MSEATTTSTVDENNYYNADLYKALYNAQNEIGKVFKNSSNSHFGSAYLDLAGLMDYVQPVLYKHGLMLFHYVVPAPDVDLDPILVTTIVHVDTGRTIDCHYPLRAKDTTDPQKLGGAVTYARRYSIMALLGLAPEDDDGNYAAGLTDAPRASTSKTTKKSGSAVKGSPNKPATDRQQKFIETLLEQTGYVTPAARQKRIKELVKKSLDDITSADATVIIDELKKEKEKGGDNPKTAPF